MGIPKSIKTYITDADWKRLGGDKLIPEDQEYIVDLIETAYQTEDASDAEKKETFDEIIVPLAQDLLELEHIEHTEEPMTQKETAGALAMDKLMPVTAEDMEEANDEKDSRA